MTIINDYLKITKEYVEIYGEKTLLLMQVGSFFECYALVRKDGTFSGSRIQEFADINDMTISRKNMSVDGQGVVMAGFGISQLEKYIKKLQDNAYTIVVYTQDTQAKNTTRSLSCIYSPGTFFALDSPELSNNTTCIWLHHSPANKVVGEKITIGLSNLDIYTGRTSIYEFSKDFHHNPCTYDELEKFIAVYKPNETIIISNLDDAMVDSVIQFANIVSTRIHKIDIRENRPTELVLQAQNVEKQKYQDAVLRKFFDKEEGLITEYYNYCIASQSLCFLLEFIYKHNPNLVSKIEKPIVENYGEKLILANHSLKQLNIISDNRFTGKLGSVSDFLNNCVTTIGKRQFRYNLLNPITNIKILNKSYDITAHVLETGIWDLMRISLGNMKDLEKIKRKLIMSKISPKDFFNLSANLSSLKDLFKKISNDKKLRAHIETYITCDFDGTCDKLKEFIHNKFDVDKCRYLDDISGEKLSGLSLEHLGFIKRGIDKDLDERMRTCMDTQEVFEAIRQYFSDVLSKCERNTKTNTGEYIKIHETAKSDAMLIGTKRRVLLLKSALEKGVAAGQFIIELKYTSKYTGKEEIYLLNISKLEYKGHGGNQTNMQISSQEIAKMSGDMQSYKDKLVMRIQAVYGDLIEKFRDMTSISPQHGESGDITSISPQNGGSGVIPPIDNIIAFISECDTLQCRAYIASKYNYCRPVISENISLLENDGGEKSFVKFEKLRHCLIEQLNTKELYVTNDLELGRDMNGVLLYGTNAVGKTSFIKAMGIAIIMAQAGLYVPCSKFLYNPYNYIFTRILGNDNIFKGLSTFAVEMSELRTILMQANENSLILGDELCSGTESTSALSIFAAGLERLHTIRASFIFATHFHEIAKYKEITILDKLRMYHMSVIYNKAKKQLIYDRKLKPGPGESMYGLEVCKSLDLPAEFLDRAHSLRQKYSCVDTSQSILSNKGTHFNAMKIKGICEVCKKEAGVEVHHLRHQKDAINGIIDGEFNMNHPANLINICEECHDKIHLENTSHKIVKSDTGYIMKEI